jgi:broad specificity phosphatase PhoE
MAQILLARHGETEWNAIGRLQGHTDVPLNEAGREQARGLIAKATEAGVTEVWSSDLSRAQQTAAIVAEALALPPPRVDAELRERRFGVFEGLTRAQCAQLHPEAWEAWRLQTAAPPGGEPSEGVVARMAGALARIAATVEQTALVVSHGGAMRLWLMQVLGQDVPLIGNGQIFVIEWQGGTLAVRRQARTP